MGEEKKVIGIPVHVLALNLLCGPNYESTVDLERASDGVREIVIRIPFPRDFPDDTMSRLHEEIANGIYLPRSEATKGLIERKDRYIKDNPLEGGDAGPETV